ncbi:9375_t:CDS:2 [Diversispora eburnea]|uniref:9375_t:CDS:1 n=1 Tax=Diversispora eburnea TaxID=1213867 RepID=A0A9N8V1S5_9GLOM|nr:9375_t:CDS:2 [Diversispora eburnea]
MYPRCISQDILEGLFGTIRELRGDSSTLESYSHTLNNEERERAKNVQQKPEDSAGLSIEYIDIPEETSPIRTEWLESNNKAEILKRYYDRFVKPIVGKEQQLSNIIFTDIGKPKIMPGNQLRKAIKHQRLRYEKIPRTEPIEWNFLDTKVKGPILGFNPEEYGIESLTLEKKSTQNYNNINSDHIVTITESVDSSNMYDERSLEKKKHDSEHGEKKRKHKKDGEHKRDKDGEHKKKKRKKHVFAA